MRDLMMLGAMLVLVPVAFTNGFVAYLLWCWAGLLGPNSFLYGFMTTLPYVQIFALISLALLLTRRGKVANSFSFNSTTALFCIFFLAAVNSAVLAYEDTPRNDEIIANIAKTTLFVVMMPLLITSRIKIYALVVLIAMTLGFHGVLDGLKFLASAGSHNARGIPKFGDNNQTALVLSMTIPLALYLARYSANRWVKLGFAATAALLVLSVVSTSSRGGLITLVSIALWLVIFSKRRVKLLAVLGIICAMVLALAPDSWKDRMDTVKDAQDDSSFMSRVAVWKKSTAIALEHPFVGGGFNSVQSTIASAKFDNSEGLLGFVTTPPPERFVAHSIYFQTMGDMGFVGFFVYVAMLLNSFIVFGRINRLAKSLGPCAKWASDLASMLAAGIFAFMVGGAALSFAYSEVPFLIMALIGALLQVLLRQAQQRTAKANKKP